MSTGSTAVSARQLEVLRLAAIGYRNKDIAAALGIAVKTVEVHKAAAMRLLHLGGRHELMRYARVQGWLADLATDARTLTLVLRDRAVLTYWRFPRLNGQTLACSSYRTAFGLELRAGVDGCVPLLRAGFTTHVAARQLAELWRHQVEALGLDVARQSQARSSDGSEPRPPTNN